MIHAAIRTGPMVLARRARDFHVAHTIPLSPLRLYTSVLRADVFHFDARSTCARMGKRNDGLTLIAS